MCMLFSGPTRTILSEYLLRAVLKLLYKEVPENGRNLHQYFSFFWMYASLGIAEVFNASHFSLLSRVHFKIQPPFVVFTYCILLSRIRI